MSEQPEPETVVSPPAVTDATSEWEPEPPAEPAAGADESVPVAEPTPSWSPPADAAGVSGGGGAAVFQQRPELAIAGAFAGGFAIAMILKRLAS